MYYHHNYDSHKLKQKSTHCFFVYDKKHYDISPIAYQIKLTTTFY